MGGRLHCRRRLIWGAWGRCSGLVEMKEADTLGVVLRRATCGLGVVGRPWCSINRLGRRFVQCMTLVVMGKVAAAKAIYMQ